MIDQRKWYAEAIAALGGSMSVKPAARPLIKPKTSIRWIKPGEPSYVADLER